MKLSLSSSQTRKFIETVKSQVPPELRRWSSVLSIVLALVFSGFFLGLGTELFTAFLNWTSPYIPSFLGWLVWLLTTPVKMSVNAITAIIFVVVFFTLYRLVDGVIVRRLKRVVVFMDDFISNKGWLLNYWGSNKPDKTCHYDTSKLVFVAEEDDLVDQKKEYGAYYDLTNGVYEHERYEVMARVKAKQGSTMGIRLWTHDIKGYNDIKTPSGFYTPGNSWEEMKLIFTATATNGMRIHLHVKPGEGVIYVDKVIVQKVN